MNKCLSLIVGMLIFSSVSTVYGGWGLDDLVKKAKKKVEEKVSPVKEEKKVEDKVSPIEEKEQKKDNTKPQSEGKKLDTKSNPEDKLFLQLKTELENPEEILKKKGRYEKLFNMYVTHSSSYPTRGLGYGGLGQNRFKDLSKLFWKKVVAYKQNKDFENLKAKLEHPEEVLKDEKLYEELFNKFFTHSGLGESEMGDYSKFSTIKGLLMKVRKKKINSNGPSCYKTIKFGDGYDAISKYQIRDIKFDARSQNEYKVRPFLNIKRSSLPDFRATLYKMYTTKTPDKVISYYRETMGPDRQLKVRDGYCDTLIQVNKSTMVLVDLLDGNVSRLRMVFKKGTKPEPILKKLKKEYGEPKVIKTQNIYLCGMHDNAEILVKYNVQVITPSTIYIWEKDGVKVTYDVPDLNKLEYKETASKWEPTDYMKAIYHRNKNTTYKNALNSAALRQDEIDMRKRQVKKMVEDYKRKDVIMDEPKGEKMFLKRLPLGSYLTKDYSYDEKYGKYIDETIQLYTEKTKKNEEKLQEESLDF